MNDDTDADTTPDIPATARSGVYEQRERTDTDTETQTTDAQSPGAPPSNEGTETRTGMFDGYYQTTAADVAAQNAFDSMTNDSPVQKLERYTDDILAAGIILIGYAFVFWTNYTGMAHQAWDQVAILGFATAILYVFGKRGVKKGAELLSNRQQ